LTSGIYYIPKQSQLVIYVTWSNPSKWFFIKKFLLNYFSSRWYTWNIWCFIYQCWYYDFHSNIDH
jgi:hypothetical protein